MNDQIIQPRNLRPLDIATYVPLCLITLLGLIVLQEPWRRVIALALCLVFGLHHAFRFRAVNTYRSLFVYFLIQTIIIVALAVISAPSDAFYFLLFVLGIQVTMLLPIRSVLPWMVIFYLLDSNGVFLNMNSGGLIELLFNGTAMFFTGVLGYSFRQTEIARREKEQVIEELETTQNQLRELAVAEERTRLARELHDSLGHQLTVAVVQLEGAQRLIPTKPDQATRMITTMRDELKGALAELRLPVSAMRSSTAVSQSLESALSALSKSFQQNTGLAIHFISAQNFPPLPERYHLAFYRGAQEALTNIQRHAGAQNAWIYMNADGTNLRLIVEDDGKGFEHQTQTIHGAGLLGLRERAEQLGGHMQISGRTGGGTQLSFTVPMPGTGIAHD
jgi:signal transduction histidine kinase